MWRRARLIFLLPAVLPVFASACHSAKKKNGELPAGAPTSPSIVRPGVRGDAGQPVQVDLISQLAHCELRDEGIVLDLGAEGTNWRRGFRLGAFDDVRPVERSGETFGQFMADRAQYQFWLREAQADLKVEVRTYGGAARKLALELDGKRLGIGRIEPGVIGTFSLAVPFELAGGVHTLGVRFLGAVRRPDEPFGEIDWLRIRAKDSPVGHPPTFRDAISEVALASVPHRVIGLKHGEKLRCPISLEGTTELAFALGFWGKGKGEASVRVLLDGEAPEVLLKQTVIGGERASFTPITLKLGRKTSGVGLVELAATVAEGGKIVFGDPVLVAARRPPVPRTKLVVVVLSSAIGRDAVPPWGSGAATVALRDLASASVAFRNYRIPTTVPAAVLASLLTGQSPRVHGLRDPVSRLNPAIQTLGRALKAAGGRAAFMTAVPSTFAAFGFDRDWDEYFSASPVLDLPATEVFSRATAWLESQKDEARTRPHLLIVHGRGVHPPWDVTKVEAQRLGPKEYAGTIDARRGGIVIGDVRRRARKLKDEDWARMEQLQSFAFAKETAAIQRLLGVLKKHALFDDALLVFMGDVGSARRPGLPYDPEAKLSEEALSVPLLIKLPGAPRRGAESSVFVSTEDIAITVAAALGLDPLPHAEGLDIFSLVEGFSPPEGRALSATRGEEYITRAGIWQLSGTLGRVPRLCRLDTDPACSEDVLGRSAYAAQAMWLATFRDLSLSKRPVAMRGPAPPPFVLDPDTQTALTVWGDIP